MGDRIHRIEIVGGGLAGLSLGLALRRAGVPVTVYEAGEYPRHRVCGEFISGLDDDTIERLKLAPLLADACLQRDVAWYVGERHLCEQTLPERVFGLSRYVLDARLAAEFVATGGELRTKCRVDGTAASPGRVHATGRRPGDKGWLGLKVHCGGLPLASDLEVHLGEHAYVGLCHIENGDVNVCGLFRRNPKIKPSELSGTNASSLLLSYLDASGLESLSKRLRASLIDEESFCAVAALNFKTLRDEPDRMHLGDTHAMIPPFTGHGMAMAFQSASLAIDPLVDYARGGSSWGEACRRVAESVSGHFRRRLAVANNLHSFLLEPDRQQWLAAAGRMGVLPLGFLYHLTH